MRFKKIAIITIICLAVTIIGCSKMPIHFPTHPRQPSPKFQPTVSVNKVWTKSIAGSATSQYLKLSPVLISGKIFVPSYNGKITALDADSGKQLWAIDVGTNVTSGLEARQNMVFVGSISGKIFAISQDKGSVVWTTAMKAQIIATPCASKDVLVVKAENGDLAAYNIFNGKMLWLTNHDVPTLILRGSSSPRIADNLVVAGFANGAVDVANLYNGTLRWREFLAEGLGSSGVEQMVDIDATPKIVHGVVYIVTYQGRIVALDLQTGKVIWQHDLSSHSGLTVDSNYVYVTDTKGYVWAFERQSGEVMWRQANLLKRNLTAPSVIDDYLAIGDSYGSLFLLNRGAGSLAAIIPEASDGFLTAPITVGKDIYVYSKAGRLSKFTIS